MSCSRIAKLGMKLGGCVITNESAYLALQRVRFSRAAESTGRSRRDRPPSRGNSRSLCLGCELVLTHIFLRCRLRDAGSSRSGYGNLAWRQLLLMPYAAFRSADGRASQQPIGTHAECVDDRRKARANS